MEKLTRTTIPEENRVAKGSYVLLLRLAHGRSIKAGRLPEIHFPAGDYAYVGSAMRGLAPRIKRHLAQDKKAKWHIDYLRQEAEVSGVIVCESEERAECAIARGLALHLREIPGFGASDCKCPSHLFFATDENQLRSTTLATLASLPIEKSVSQLDFSKNKEQKGVLNKLSLNKGQIMLVRHGETEWNRQEIFRGRTDVGLNENGIKQAERLARYLSRLKLTAVYASPLSRALKTAELICRHHNLTVSVTNGLIDFDYGRWQGQKDQEVRESYPELYAEWLEHPQRVKMPDGESLSDVRKRALRVVKKVVAEHEGTVVLVSHRVVNKVLTCALLGLDNSHFWNVRQDTAGITTFAHEDGRFVLTEHNNTSFLQSLPKASPVDF